MQSGDLTEGYFSAVTRASLDVVRIVSLDGRVEYMNDRGKALLEISDFERNRGQLLSDLWPKESHRKLNLALKRARAGESLQFNAPCPTAKGRRRWWSHVVAPIVDEQGEVVRLIVTSRDITGQLRREKRLRNAVRSARAAQAVAATRLADLRGALEALPVGVALYDAEDRLQIWNDHYAAAGVTGTGQSPLKVGRTFEELLRASVEQGAHPDALGKEEIWIQDRLARRNEASGTHEQELSDGRWFRFEDRPLDHGGFVAIAIEITQHKEREATLCAQKRALEEAHAAAQAASQAKSEFLANMSHEIRTPLNGVVGMADILSKSNLSKADREIAEIIRSSGETLEQLLSDILDIARIEAQQMSFEREPFHLGDAVRGTLALMRLKAEEKGIDLRLDLPSKLDCGVIGDSLRVRQILTNLISNAVKFTEVGEVVVSVRPRDGDVIRFTVTDTGIGFNPAEQDVFGRFQQADGSITRRFGGSGLGLAISKELADKLGGTLACTSRPGLGSSFWLDLPLVRQCAASTVEPTASATVPEIGLRVLVADDHPTNLKVAELILGQIGAETVTTTNGAEALTAYRCQSFDLVLMDMQMPVLDGIAAVRAIRDVEREAGAPRTPILMLTANAMPQHLEASRMAGADGHVTKPVTSESLLRSIESALSASSGGGAHAEAGCEEPNLDRPQKLRV